MRPRLDVTVSRDRIIARVRRGRRTLWSGECELPGTEGLADALAALQRRDDFPKNCDSLRFLIEPPLVQLRTLRDLPPVRGAELRRVVEQQSARFFRRRNGSLVVDATWQDRRNGTAYAGAMDAELIDVMRSAAEDLNLTLIEILTAHNKNSVQTLRFVKRRGHAGRMMRFVAGSIFISAWICGSYMTGYVVDLELDRRRLARELETLQPELAVLDEARREIADVVSVVGVIETREASRGWVTALLAGLTEALPDSAHVVAVTGNLDQLTVELRARDPNAVVDSLVSQGLLVVPEYDEDTAAEDAEEDGWRAITIHLNGGPRAGS